MKVKFKGNMHADSILVSDGVSTRARVAPKSIHWMRKILAILSSASLSSCMTIGDIGGPGHMLITHIKDGMGAETAPLFRDNPIPNKIRIGHLGNDCVRWFSRSCIEISAGAEIEQRPDLIRVFEQRIQRPCDLLNTPFGQSDPQSRNSAYREFFDCDSPPESRTVRYVELQTLLNPTLQKPQILRVRTYRIPAAQ